MPYTYEYPHPSVTVDCVIFGINFDEKKLEVLSIVRGKEPFAGKWANPGGFVNENEDLDAAAARELEEETGAQIEFMEQLYTFGTPGRDPRGHVITVAYYALAKKVNVQGSDDAARAEWKSVDWLLSQELAFDHNKILAMALSRLQAKIRYAPIGFNLLPENFTMADLHELYSIVLQRKIDPTNFRKKILMMNILEEVGVQTDVKHRPAKIYKFNKEKYETAAANGFNFQI